MIYMAMTGAKHTLGQHAAVSNNLANANTTGYRAETSVLRAVPVFSDTLATRAFVVDSSGGADFRPGTVQETGRELDMAVQGSGWIAVQLEDGSEAYTRNGNLHVSVNGYCRLVTARTYRAMAGQFPFRRIPSSQSRKTGRFPPRPPAQERTNRIFRQ